MHFALSVTFFFFFPNVYFSIKTVLRKSLVYYKGSKPVNIK